AFPLCVQLAVLHDREVHRIGARALDRERAVIANTPAGRIQLCSDAESDAPHAGAYLCDAAGVPLTRRHPRPRRERVGTLSPSTRSRSGIAVGPCRARVLAPGA